MRSLLARPYPLSFEPAYRWRLTLAFSLFVALFLWVFQPFGLASYPGSLATVALGYGLCCGLGMFITGIFFPALWPRFFSESDWTLGRELFLVSATISLVALANLFYTVLIGISRLSWLNMGWFFFYTWTVGVFPVSLMILLRQQRSERYYQEASEQLNRRMAPASSLARGEGQWRLDSQNQGESLLLSREELLFVRAADNYLEVHFYRKGALHMKLLRNSLKALCESLGEEPALFRCHRSYLVNLHKVIATSGNAQGYKLHFSESEERIPVSRSLNQRLTHLLPSSSR